MANTYVDYTGDNSETDFIFNFDYLQDDHVKVKVNDVIVTNYSIVEVSADNVIRFDTAPASNASIRIYRDSRGDFSPLVDFVDGSVLTGDNLDEAYKHNLFVSQEASEGTGNELLNKKGGANYDAEGNKIINLGTPTTGTDAANKGYVDQTIDNAELVGGSPATVSLGGYDVTSSNDTLKQLTAWTADIEANASNISTNTSNISTNTSNISTNTTNIATNTSNISSNALISAMVSRPTMQYKDADEVYFKGLKEVSMCGFRFQGMYEKQAGKKFSISGDYPSASLSADLEYESSYKTKEWYAVFAVADDGDANAIFKIVPFLQVKSVAGSVVTLNEVYGADGSPKRILEDTTYNWSDDALNDAECLVITETIDDRANSWSGRKTTITDSTNSTVTLNSAGTLDKFDWILPAPKSKSNYVYLGSLYVDSAEVLNFADGNGIVSQDTISLETAHSFDADAIATSQTPSGAGNLTLDGAASSGGAWGGEAGHLIYFTTVADETSRTVTITGVIEGSGSSTENVTLGNNTVVNSVGRFKSITSIAIDGATTNNVSVGINGQDSISNALPTAHPGVPIILSGLISPLATGVKMQLGFSFSGTELGNDNVKICHDSSNHIISQNTIDKETQASGFNRIQANEIYTFSFFQMLYIYSTGSLNSSGMTRKIHLNGYYEP